LTNIKKYKIKIIIIDLIDLLFNYTIKKK